MSCQVRFWRPSRRSAAAAGRVLQRTDTKPGINTTLEWMTRQRGLGTIVLAYVYAAFLVAGPWIFTVVGIVALSAARCTAVCDELPVFRSIVIYNSLYALVVTSPLAFLCGRYVSGQLYAGRAQSVFFALVGALGVFCLITVVTVAPFYLVATTLDGPTQIAAIQCAFLIGVSWLLIPFLSVMKAHNAILLGFGANALSMVVFGLVLTNPSATRLLIAFNVSFAITDAILIGTIVREYGIDLERDPNLWQFAAWKWELPLTGLAYALGIWSDKLIMWFWAPSGGLSVAGVLRTMPAYDTAMFWAQLASIPIIAVAFVHVETRFSHLFRRFYGRLDQQASLRELTSTMAQLRTFVISNVISLFVALAIVAIMTILLSFVFMTELGLRPTYMSILRVSLWGMVFHTSSMFCFFFLLYFDLRRPALIIVCTFFVLNTVFTLALLPFGQALYGYGNMVAAAATFVLALTFLLRELPWLHYHAFVTNNTSV
jgi:polysaccharide biosynthesis protein PelG